MDSQLIITKESKANLATTWKIYKSHWKTFLSLTGFLVLAYVIYIILDSVLSIVGLAPIMYTDYEYVGTGSLVAAYIIRTPIYLIYSIVTALLTTLFTVVPVLYFRNQEVITWKVPYKELRKNFKRYLLAGFLYSICLVIGYLLCVVPGIAISFIGPAYVNKIVCSDLPIVKAFSSSFQAVFKSPNLWSYIGMTILAALLYLILTVCSCGIGSIITFPLLSIYSIHLAYNKGIIN